MIIRYHYEFIVQKSNHESLPVLLWIHGGGYILGSIDDNDDTCMRFAKEASCVVVSVDYRLAPEHPTQHQLRIVIQL